MAVEEARATLDKAIPESNVGFKMLQKMGWTVGHACMQPLRHAWAFPHHQCITSHQYEELLMPCTYVFPIADGKGSRSK